MRQTVILTGAAGFIGRHMARALEASGWRVVGVDMAPSENAPTGTLARYVQCHLPDPGFEALLEAERPDAMVHCAGRASVGMSFEDPAADFRAGTVLTFELLDALRKHAPNCRFLFLSSAAVYGDPETLPVGETARVKPISPYGFHKRHGELLCEEFSSLYGIPTSCLRIFSAYGPGLRRQVIWDLCHQAVTRGTLVLKGTGGESRDFIHVRDVVSAARLVLQKAEMRGEVYNVASGEEVTIRELASGLARALELDVEPEFDGVVPVGNPLNWRADISKLRALGFSPSWNLERGLHASATWCRAELCG